MQAERARDAKDVPAATAASQIPPEFSSLKHHTFVVSHCSCGSGIHERRGLVVLVWGLSRGHGQAVGRGCLIRGLDRGWRSCSLPGWLPRVAVGETPRFLTKWTRL